MIRINSNFLVMENHPLLYPGLEYNQKFIHQIKRANNLLSTYMEMNDTLIEFLLRYEKMDNSEEDLFYDFHENLVGNLCFFVVNFYSYYNLDMKDKNLLLNFGKFLNSRLEYIERTMSLLVNYYSSDYDANSKLELENSLVDLTSFMLDSENISKIPDNINDRLSCMIDAISAIYEVDSIKELMTYWNRILVIIERLMRDTGFCGDYWEFPDFNPVYTNLISDGNITVENILKYGVGLYLDYDYRDYAPQLDRAMDLILHKSEIERLMIIVNKSYSDSYSYGENYNSFNALVDILQGVLKPTINTIIKHLSMYVFHENASIKMLETMSLVEDTIDNKDDLEIDSKFKEKNSNLGFKSFRLFEQPKILLSVLEEKGNKERYRDEVKAIIKYWSPTMFPLEYSTDLFSKKDYFNPYVKSILDCHQLIAKILDDLNFTIKLFGYKDGHWDLNVNPIK